MYEFDIYVYVVVGCNRWMKLLPLEHEASRSVRTLWQSYDIILDAAQFNWILCGRLIQRRWKIAAIHSCGIDWRTWRGGRINIGYRSVCIVRSNTVFIRIYRRFSAKATNKSNEWMRWDRSMYRIWHVDSYSSSSSALLADPSILSRASAYSCSRCCSVLIGALGRASANNCSLVLSFDGRFRIFTVGSGGTYCVRMHSSSFNNITLNARPLSMGFELVTFFFSSSSLESNWNKSHCKSF